MQRELHYVSGMPDAASDIAPPSVRSMPLALWRGARKRCPACGKASLFSGFLSVTRACPSCGEELHHQRADDAPAYFTIFIVGHIAVGGVLWAERAYSPEPWVQGAIWITLAIVLSLWLLPRIKGMLVALQWALRMHGFAGKAVEHDLDPTAPQPAPTPTRA